MIDISAMAAPELRALVAAADARIRVLEGTAGLGSPRSAFKVGDVVEFHARGRNVVARIMGFNSKTISVVELTPAPGKLGKWRVSPEFLKHHVEPPESKEEDIKEAPPVVVVSKMTEEELSAMLGKTTSVPAPPTVKATVAVPAFASTAEGAGSW